MTEKWRTRGTVLIRLGRQHFAFFRGYLDGLDLRQLSERYLTPSLADSAESSDIRMAKSLVSWISEQLLVAARRTGTASDARILQMRAERLGPAPCSDVPDLEEFREERDPHQMYSEQDLLELFEQEYGSPAIGDNRRAKRSKRLRARQIAVLNKLEGLISADPHPDDAVSGWLDAAIARRLIAVSIQTLNDLVAVIEANGFRWYTKVPRIGLKAAQSIIDWLLMPDTVASLGATLSIRSIRPRSQIMKTDLPGPGLITAIVPIEAFEVPQALSGARGTNRGTQPFPDADNDLEAINCWLARSPPGSTTHRCYRKEAERFLLWAVLEARSAVSSLTVAECISYRDFLSRLGRETPETWARQFKIPQSSWLGQRGIDRFSSRWRPFEGPLSPSSQKTAIVILQGMMQWLADLNYLHNNPFKTMAASTKAPIVLPAKQPLTSGELSQIEHYLASIPNNKRNQRLRIIVALACGAGCSPTQIAALTRRDLGPVDGAAGQYAQWELSIPDKDGTSRRARLSPRLLSDVRTYFLLRGYGELASVSPCVPLIAAASLSGTGKEKERALSGSRIYKLIKLFIEEVAVSANECDPVLAAKFRLLSTHGLRHTIKLQAHQGVLN